MKTVPFFIAALLTICCILPLSAQVQDANTVRILSYNVRNGMGIDDITDYERTAAVIRKLSPDVVALQELDSVTGRSKGVDVLHKLSDLTKMYEVYGASINYDGGKYGIGVLSKKQPISSKRIPLPGREEARSLLVVEFPEYVFCCTHLSLKKEDRLAAIEIISREAAAFNKPVFLAGDLNARPDSPEITELKKDWKIFTNPRQFTFPADKPNETIDYIAGYKTKGQDYSVLRAAVLDEPKASDHRPLFADIRLPKPASAILRTMPYLQNPAPDAVTVMWHTTVPCYSWVEYGMDSLNMKRARAYAEGEVIANTTLNRIRLEGLTPGTKYYYRICSQEITLYEPYRKEFGETARSGIVSFTTLDNKQKDFTAIIFNDLHDSYPLFDKLYAQVKDIPRDIVFFNGDCIADVQSVDIAIRTINYYSSQFGGDRTPSVYIRGNHETRGAYSPFLWNCLEKIGPHSYGAFNIGDTRFVMLDCGEDKPDSTPVYYDLNDFTQYRKDQAEFLKKEIASKEFKSAAKRVLIHHIPVYGNDDKYRPCTEYWGEILSKANFDVCLNGHTHRYEYLPEGKYKNNFPVIIGGGSNAKSATVAILRKTAKAMKLTVLDAEGNVKLELNL